MKHTLILKQGREKSLLNRHPWIFSGAIARIDSDQGKGEGEPGFGETVAVKSQDGRFLGWAAWSPQSQIRGRVWSFREQETITADFFRERIQRAITLRSRLGQRDGVRLIHGESDGLPGLVVDRYGPVVVMQLLSAGPESWRDTIADHLASLPGVECVYERSDADVRHLEGLENRTGVVRGTLPADLRITENGVHYHVDVANGQKTGFYLDQRESRRIIGELARDKSVLNCFCYTGGFSLAALTGGASSVESVDSSNEALQLAQRNLALNVAASGLDASRATWVEADVFQYLRKLRDANRQYDLIILDPPKFAPTAQHIEKAARAYKDINLWALKLLKPGGLLATFTCSGGMTAELFQKILAGAAVDARAEAQVIGQFRAEADHPVNLAFPEGDYLKGLLIQKVS